MERTLSSGLTVGLADQSLKQLLPHLFSAVAARGRKRTVCASLENRKLVANIKGALTVEVLREYLQLWDLLQGFELQPEVEDSHIWQFPTSGNFSTKSAYEAFFFHWVHSVQLLGKNLEKLGP